MSAFAEEKDHRICAVCGRVLDVVRTGRGTKFQHTIQDQENEDHPPVAVPISEAAGQLRGRCDFCTSEEPIATLPVSDFTYSTIPDAGSAGGGAACAECSRLIETGQWNRLFRRARAAWELKSGVPMGAAEEEALRALYRQIRKHVTGPLVPLAREGMG